MVNEGGDTMDLTNDERAALAVLDDMTLAAREAYNAALLACNAAESEYEYASMAAALVMVRRALAAEAEVTRLRAENATLRASTDAAVDGVRAMLPAALKVAREEGAAELRALMAGRTTPPTREEFTALAEMGATLRVVWFNGSDEIHARDAYWGVVMNTPNGSRWWAHSADGALIEWPKVKP